MSAIPRSLSSMESRHNRGLRCSIQKLFRLWKAKMSYLGPLRLHFAGKFQAAPSTVINDTTHFNNATFNPEFQKRQTPGHPNGWWNPDGDADWRLIGCKVTGAFDANGNPVAGDVPPGHSLDSNLLVAKRCGSYRGGSAVSSAFSVGRRGIPQPVVVDSNDGKFGPSWKCTRQMRRRIATY